MSSQQSMNMTDTIDGGNPVGLLLLLSAITVLSQIGRRHRFISRGPSHRRARQEFWYMTDYLSDQEFERMFRMSRDTFKDLCGIIRPRISPRVQVADSGRERSRHVAGGHIQTEVKVAVFLRIIAGATFLDVHLLFGIGRSSAYRFFRKVLMAVLEELPWQCIPIDSRDGGFKDMALSFTHSRPVMNPLPGCIAAVDGLQLQIERPAREYNPLQYFSRKIFFTVPVQAVVDAGYRFIACSVLAVGSTHDNVAFALSEFYSYLHSGKVPNGFWVAGDEAYRCTETVIIPFAKSLITVVHDALNFFHSSHRIHVEQAFGILKRRWGILTRPLSFGIEVSTKIIPAAMKLHNFCMNMDGGNLKPPRTAVELRIAEERLNFWLRWCQTGEDVDEIIQYEVEDMSASASRAERRSETRRKLVVIVRREHLRRLSSSIDN